MLPVAEVEHERPSTSPSRPGGSGPAPAKDVLDSMPIPTSLDCNEVRPFLRGLGSCGRVRLAGALELVCSRRLVDRGSADPSSLVSILLPSFESSSSSEAWLEPELGGDRVKVAP